MTKRPHSLTDKRFDIKLVRATHAHVFDTSIWLDDNVWADQCKCGELAEPSDHPFSTRDHHATPPTR